VFDLIEVDLASAEAALDEGQYYAAATLASRALLVTRGEEPKNDLDALKLFRKHFVNEGLVETQCGELVERAIASAATEEPQRSFHAERSRVASLVATARKLYENMDSSLRFSRPAPSAAAEPPRTDADVTADTTEDYRGVACPLNYVKAKLALEAMEAGQVLALLVGAEGAQNVPASAASDGHDVLSVTQEGDQWRILIRKGQGA
jgi:sulfite reductase (ferredoxin)